MDCKTLSGHHIVITSRLQVSQEVELAQRVSRLSCKGQRCRSVEVILNLKVHQLASSHASVSSFLSSSGCLREDMLVVDG